MFFPLEFPPNLKFVEPRTDLYGRGYSDAPQTTYDTPLFTTQLALLLQHIKWDQAYIVGVSMVSRLRPLRFYAVPNVSLFLGWWNCRCIYSPVPTSC